MKFRNQILTQTTGTVVLMFSQWLISVLLVRLGGFADAGIFSLAMSVANVFTAIADCGIRPYLISDVNDQFTREQYILARAGMILVSFVVFGGYLLAEGSAYSTAERSAILLYLVYVNTNSYSDVHFGALQVHDKLYVNGFSNVMRGVLGAAAFFLVFILSHSMIWALSALALNSLAIFLLYDHRQYKREFSREAALSREDFSSAVQIVKLCFPLMLVAFFGLVLTAAPRRTINVMIGNEELGYFASLFAPAALISSMGTSVVYAFVPKLSDRWKQGNIKGFLKLACGCYGGAIAFTAAAELCAAAVGRPIVRLIFGEGIMPYYSLLYVAILSYGLSTMSFCGYSVLMSLRKIKTLMAIAMTGMLFMVGTVGLLVDRAGISGAAEAMVLAYSVQCILHISMIVYTVRQGVRKENT